MFCGGLGKSADLKLSDKGNQLYLDVERFFVYGNFDCKFYTIS